MRMIVISVLLSVIQYLGVVQIEPCPWLCRGGVSVDPKNERLLVGCKE